MSDYFPGRVSSTATATAGPWVTEDIESLLHLILVAFSKLLFPTLLFSKYFSYILSLTYIKFL